MQLEAEESVRKLDRHAQRKINDPNGLIAPQIPAFGSGGRVRVLPHSFATKVHPIPGGGRCVAPLSVWPVHLLLDIDLLLLSHSVQCDLCY